jgi:hypothetical protein
MKHVVVWQVVRRASMKYGVKMVFPLANFDKEEDAIKATKILDAYPMPDGLTSREHSVERLELSLFESMDEFNDARIDKNES